MTILRTLMKGRPAPVFELSRELAWGATHADVKQARHAIFLMATIGDPGSWSGRARESLTPEPETLLALIETSGLRGRGGAGFPAATKLRAVRDIGRETGRAPVVVANEEGEPGSVKDRWLLRQRPGLVLRGLLHAVAITGADRGYVYVSDPAGAHAVRHAVREAAPSVPIEIVEVEHTYVAGEETAVVRRIDGGPALPRAKPPRPFESGVGAAPTLVANVETLARIALLPTDPDAADSLLVTVSARTAEPVLAEVGRDTTLLELARALDLPGLPTAILMGGLFGGILGPARLTLPLGPVALKAAGTGLGCGAVRFLYKGECPVAVVGDAQDRLAAEGSRQCGVCVSGTAALARTMRSLRNGLAGPEDLANLRRWAGSLPGRGACGLVDAAAHLAGSLLADFPDLVRSHLGRPCQVCAKTPPDSGAHLVVAVPEQTEER